MYVTGAWLLLTYHLILIGFERVWQTYTGHILTVLNPYENLDLYSAETIKSYRGKSLGESHAQLSCTVCAQS
jgi:hypothetical protein